MAMNCLECEHGQLRIEGFARDWGLCCYGVPEQAISVKAMVQHDGRVIAPPWCPLSDHSEGRGGAVCASVLRA